MISKRWQDRRAPPALTSSGPASAARVVSPQVRLYAGAFVTDSVVLDGVINGHGATIHWHVAVPDRDRARGCCGREPDRYRGRVSQIEYPLRTWR